LETGDETPTGMIEVPRAIKTGLCMHGLRKKFLDPDGTELQTRGEAATGRQGKVKEMIAPEKKFGALQR